MCVFESKLTGQVKLKYAGLFCIFFQMEFDNYNNWMDINTIQGVTFDSDGQEADRFIYTIILDDLLESSPHFQPQKQTTTLQDVLPSHAIQLTKFGEFMLFEVSLFNTSIHPTTQATQHVKTKAMLQPSSNITLRIGKWIVYNI